jgi:hypothetical protein
MIRKRLLNLALFLTMLVTEVLIALFIHDSFIRPYVGDVLVVAVVYFFLRIFIPEKYPWLPAAVFVFAAAVEFSQYLGLTDRLGITNPILRIALGSVYDTTDIVCYGIGCAFLAAYELARRKRNR